jgi:radical SAM superfamily enzyme YgiQ (UPF0313 family)
MHVALVSVYGHSGCTLKDVAGGYGTVFEVGSSLRARLLEAAKSRVAKLPPIVLGYLSAQLVRAGHRVSVFDLSPASDAPRTNAAIVLSSIVDASAERAMCAKLRAAGVRTIVIGAYASARPEWYADDCDAVIAGEPEVLGAEILDARGVCRVGDVADLDALPFPDWDPFPVAQYRYAFLTRRGATLPVSAARGCAYGCGYCPWRATASFRQRDPDRVCAEIALLKARYGLRGVAFRDPLFNLDADRVRRIARGLAPLDVRFSAEMRPDRIDEEMLHVLHRAGLRSLEIGVESKRVAMLAREKRKPPTLAEIERVVRAAQRAGVRVICNYVLGLPDDDEEAIRETVEWAKRLDSFAVQFTIATPYPGTTLEERAKGSALPLAPDAHTGFRPTFRHRSIAPERLEALREWAYVSYHFRPRYALRFARSAARALLD